MSQSKSQSRLAYLRQKLNRPGPVEQAGLDYFNCPTKDSLVRLLRSDRDQLQAVLELIQAIDGCARKARCRLSVCRNCGDRMKAAELKADIKALIASAGSRPPQDQLAWVTINHCFVDGRSEPECVRAAKGFRKALSNAFQRHLKGYKAVGHMDVGDDGVLHTHLLVWSRDMNRTALSETLRMIWNKPRAVNVADWYQHKDHSPAKQERLQRKEISLDDMNLLGVVCYAIKVQPELATERAANDNLRLVHKEEIAAIVGLKLLALQNIRSEGMRGGRIRIGVLNPEWKFDRDLLVHKTTGECRTIPLITELMKRKRTGRETAFIAEKRKEQAEKRLMKGLSNGLKRGQRARIGGNVLLLVPGGKGEVYDPETGEVFDLTAGQSPSPEQQSNPQADSNSNPQQTHPGSACPTASNRRDNQHPNQSIRPDRGSG